MLEEQEVSHSETLKNRSGGEDAAVTAVLVAYNSAEVIARALEALKACGLAACLVVDNASADGTCTAVEACGGATLIRNAANVGYGSAANVALSRIGTEFVLLVNPDSVVDRRCLEALLEAARRYPEAAIVAPLLLGEDGTLHRSYKRSVFHREQARDAYRMPEGDLCAEFLSGAVWLVRSAALERIGLFDERLFLFYEDDDFCLRARKAGYGLVLASAARAYHLMGRSSGASAHIDALKQREMAWSRLYLERKYRGLPAALRLAFSLLPRYGAKWLLYALLFSSAKRRRYAARLAGVRRFLLKGAASATAATPSPTAATRT